MSFLETDRFQLLRQIPFTMAIFHHVHPRSVSDQHRVPQSGALDSSGQRSEVSKDRPGNAADTEIPATSSIHPQHAVPETPTTPRPVSNEHMHQPIQMLSCFKRIRLPKFRNHPYLKTYDNITSVSQIPSRYPKGNS